MAKRCAVAQGAHKVRRATIPQVQACGVPIRRKALSDFGTFDPHRSGDAGSFGSQVNSRGTIRKERVTDSASGGTETDSGVPAGDHESVRGTAAFGEGSPRTEKVREGSASSTLKRRRSSGAPRVD